MSTPAKEEPKPTEPIENAAGEKPLSKSQLKKLAAKKEKEAKKAARAKELAEQRNAAQNAIFQFPYRRAAKYTGQAIKPPRIADIATQKLKLPPLINKQIAR